VRHNGLAASVKCETTRNYKTSENPLNVKDDLNAGCKADDRSGARRPAHYGNKLISGGTIVQKLRLADDEVQNRRAADPSPTFQSCRVRTEGAMRVHSLRAVRSFCRVGITTALVLRACYVVKT